MAVLGRVHTHFSLVSSFLVSLLISRLDSWREMTCDFLWLLIWLFNHYKIELFFSHSTRGISYQATSNQPTHQHVDSRVYPSAKQPTPPRFQVGDIVHTHGVADLPGYSLGVNSTKYINELMERYGYTEDQVIIKPAVFGVIVDEPEYGETVFDCTTGKSQYATRLTTDILGMVPMTRCWSPRSTFLALALCGSFRTTSAATSSSGSTRKPYLRSKPPTQFQPMCDENGSPVFNKSIMSEQQLSKAPNFIDILRAKVHKRTQVEKFLNKHLQLDDDSTKGIASIVCTY